MQQTICAKVHQKLLTKADRLFTGTLEGRMIEVLQNARRAGATKVEITSNNGLIIIQDNGAGIQDFQKLLDLGSSGWDEAIENAEDPAGVGIFSLAPREVTVESGKTRLVITQKIWTGEPARLFETQEPVEGTRLQFRDEPWELKTVEKYAVFTGLEVTVNGKSCAKKRFCSRQATHYPQLGCRIEVRKRDHLSNWHSAYRTNYYHQEVLVNFHGQVVSFDYEPLRAEHLTFLVDLTGESTGLRLMLPARTRMVENEVFNQLKAILEKEAYHFIQKQGKHTLPYDSYLRAKQLGIDLPESEPVFDVGLLDGDTPQPMEIFKPKDLPLSRCYQMKEDANDIERENAHILAAAGVFPENTHFIPVEIRSLYEGYSWAKLPVIEVVKVTVGKELGSSWIWGSDVEAYDTLEISVLTSDGKRYESKVPIAIVERKHNQHASWIEKTICLTQAARKELSDEDIWHHFGGWSEDGDTYDTQLYQFGEELNRFWADILGPEEFLRNKLLGTISDFASKWKKLTIHDDGTMTILYEDGTEKTCKSAYENSNP
jgi:hypothetical protein